VVSITLDDHCIDHYDEDNDSALYISTKKNVTESVKTRRIFKFHFITFL